MPALAKVLAALERSLGAPASPPVDGPFEWILWENVAYLAPDTKRAAAFEALRTTVGLDPVSIAEADDEDLLAVARLGGAHPELRADRLRAAAERVLEEFDGDLDEVLDLPPEKASRALKRFPAVGKPGADRILARCGVPVLGLDSNGLRVLVRLGFGAEESSYDKTYRRVLAAVGPQVVAWEAPRLSHASDLLQAHGRAVCKHSRPACGGCVLRRDCPAALSD